MASVSEKVQGIEETAKKNQRTLPLLQLQNKTASIRRDPNPNLDREGLGVGPDNPLSAIV